MKVVRRISLPVLAVVLFFAGAVVLAWAQEGDGLRLPGVNTEDKHPNGCVDCHANQGEGRDYRLNVSIEDHPDITAVAKTLPKDCGMCHRPNVAAGPLNKQTHALHYQNPSENVFVTVYGGHCLECHAVNSETGEMSIKQGPKNW